MDNINYQHMASKVIDMIDDLVEHEVINAFSKINHTNENDLIEIYKSNCRDQLFLLLINKFSNTLYNVIDDV